MSELGTAARRVAQAYECIRNADRPEVWITLRPEADVLREAEAVDLAVANGAELPLAGLVVGVKDNIDVLGLPTTAGCPAFAYEPEATAPSVLLLVEAGAIVLGKTNLDQFATGLVGTRTPYGVVRNAWDPERVSGGSSSGSAVAVALGMVDIGVATDTAGSGRVPAAFQGIVGFKPTAGLVSTVGVVPASRSFDCVSVFTGTVAEAELVSDVMAGGPQAWPADAPLGAPPEPVVAIPREGQLGPLPPGWGDAFLDVVSKLVDQGARIVEIDATPFFEGSSLLYSTALVAERYEAVGSFIDAHPGEVDPSVGSIISAGGAFGAHEFARDRERVAALREQAFEALGDADVLLLPTTTAHPTIAEVAADPIAVNRGLGRFVSFANPFGFAAVSVPAGEVDGAPFGVTVYARGFADRVASDLARAVAGEPPATGRRRPDSRTLFVIGAHLTGQPLNRELTSRGARFLGSARSAARYRFYALATTPPKPGLLEAGENGVKVEGELWELSSAALGSLLSSLPEPMLLGAVELEDGITVTGFSCQASAVEGAEDISGFGGWRAYLASRALGAVAAAGTRTA